MKNGKPTPMDRFIRYFGVFGSQFLQNREYLYFWLFATLIDVAILARLHPIFWALVAIINIVIGVIAIGTVVRPIDKAFETIGLDFSKGYGLPHWIVKGKYPRSKEALRIRAAGYSEEDFQKHLPQIASRLNQDILGLRKVAPNVPEIEILLRGSILPESLPFESLNLNTLARDEFYVGKSAEHLEKLSLTQMVHLLVAGQPGSGKTQFLRQLIATVMTHARGSHICLIDMKGGIDFQQFIGAPNFEMVTNYNEADFLLNRVIDIYEKRKDYVLSKKKNNWSEFQMGELEREEALKGQPLGPIVLVVDELAELSKKATEKSAKSELQEKIATLARLARFTGIHLVLGTQRPDKTTIDMQSKDNISTRMCFSVPSVTASNLVIGDMSASTIGHHPGRGIYQKHGNKVIQAPLITNTVIEKIVSTHTEKLKQLGYDRGILRQSTKAQEKAKEVKLK